MIIDVSYWEDETGAYGFSYVEIPDATTIDRILMGIGSILEPVAPQILWLLDKAWEVKEWARHWHFLGGRR